MGARGALSSSPFRISCNWEYSQTGIEGALAYSENQYLQNVVDFGLRLLLEILRLHRLERVLHGKRELPYPIDLAHLHHLLDDAELRHLRAHLAHRLHDLGHLCGC